MNRVLTNERRDALSPVAIFRYENKSIPIKITDQKIDTSNSVLLVYLPKRVESKSTCFVVRSLTA